jgi:predicted dithiol-disulfide oxidoreductase (DUF899 family)
MTTRARIRWTEQGVAAWNGLTAAQRDQARRLLQAVSIAPTAGLFYRRTRRGWILRIASAADTHLIYNVVYEYLGTVILVVDIQVFEWTPPHAEE